MSTILYIGGLGHSGSTLLNLLLSTGGKAVALGEAARTICRAPEIKEKRICTCGVSVADCTFWAPVLEQIKILGLDASMACKYEVIIGEVEKQFGPDMSIVDSSKQYQLLMELNKDLGTEIRLIHNIKDVRAYTISQIDTNIRKQRQMGLGFCQSTFWYWYKINQTLDRLGNGLFAGRYVRVSYEDICFRPEETFKKINESMDLKYINPHNAHLGHIITGNKSVRQMFTNGIQYDNRWFSRSEWLWPYALFRNIRTYNESLY